MLIYLPVNSFPYLLQYEDNDFIGALDAFRKAEDLAVGLKDKKGAFWRVKGSAAYEAWKYYAYDDAFDTPKVQASNSHLSMSFFSYMCSLFSSLWSDQTDHPHKQVR